MGTHTPGPWKFNKSTMEIYAGGQSICSMAKFRDGTSDYPNYEANARLIAAAPELIEALNRYFREMEIGDIGQRDIEGFEKVARNAIKKAEGKQ